MQKEKYDWFKILPYWNGNCFAIGIGIGLVKPPCIFILFGRRMFVIGPHNKH